MAKTQSAQKKNYPPRTTRMMFYRFDVKQPPKKPKQMPLVFENYEEPREGYFYGSLPTRRAQHPFGPK